MSSALALTGWAAAAAALAAVLFARRALASRLRAVAEACHELRAPLAAVTLGLELGGRRGSLSPARVRAIELELGRAALALQDLESVRGPARRPARGGPVGAEEVRVRELLADSVEAWRPAATVRGVDVRLRWSGSEAVVVGDRLRIAQATANLICNAIDHGGGEVEVSGRAASGVVRIEVSDEGPGLDAPVAEVVRRARPGDRHGHGLRVAHAIALAHGGSLAAAPANRGARLVLELPASRPHAPTQPQLR
jgi:signal transduction histidine kinase